MSIIIQADYWNGTQCVENEVPWQVPGSIHLLDATCKPTDTVVEIGTGGSTLFYARRCKSVLSIETNRSWYATMQKILEEKGITNVTYLLIEDQKSLEDKLSLLTDDFDIASVDSVHGYDRSAFLTIILEKCKKLTTIVLDNYAARELFPNHHDKSVEQMVALCGSGKWCGVDFDDSHWCGRGTRILRCAAEN